jgi:hypothetical protein
MLNDCKQQKTEMQVLLALPLYLHSCSHNCTESIEQKHIMLSAHCYRLVQHHIAARHTWQDADSGGCLLQEELLQLSLLVPGTH